MADTGRKNQNAPPLRVWGFTLLVCGLLFAAVSAYDYYYNRHNRYIERIEEHIVAFKPANDKPLVVTMGASLEMLSTHRNWETEEFEWFRLIFQGSRIGNFNPVASHIVNLNPDLLILGLHLFKPASYVGNTRRALRRLVRMPLEHQGIIARRNQFEVAGCTGSIWEMDRAVDRIKREFNGLSNSLDSSPFLDQIRKAGISVILIRIPLITELETQVPERNFWLTRLSNDSQRLGLKIYETGWTLDKSFFCDDLLHMNEKGRERFSNWLKPIVNDALQTAQ
jgi:hypothetical protein